MPGHHVAWVEGHLFGFGKKVVRIAVEGQFADAAAPEPVLPE